MISLPLTLLWSSASIVLATTTSSVSTSGTILSSTTPTTEISTVPGEALPPSAFGRSWVETMADVEARELANPTPPGIRLVREPTNPRRKEIDREKAEASKDTGGHQTLGGTGTSPIISTNFEGPAIGNPGGGWIPPDTCGAVGISHFVAVVNSKIVVYNKTGGAPVMNVGQGAFWATGSLGDGRVAFDPHSQRFILLSEDFTSRIYIAVSTTSNPTGAWFKTSFLTTGGTDGAAWPDYPTLGVDANGIYTSMYQVGSPGDTMTLFALNKAPLVAAVQSLGTVTAFRGLPWEGAIHPCVTHGTPAGEYCISYSSLYRVNPPLTAPTLTDLGFSQIPGFGAPPNAPNMGGLALDTLDGRLMNAVYRNGSVWTTHAVSGGGKSVCKWYQINVTGTPSLTQSGIVDDPVRYLFAPGISANSTNQMVLGFTGSSASQFASSYVTGRKTTDPTGQTGPIVLLKAGAAGYSDGRWGDYSLTSIDPTNDNDFWTVQEHTKGSGGNWGTWIGKIIFDSCVPVTPSNFCTGAPNSAGPGATMSWSGTNQISQNNFVLMTFGAPPNKTCMYIYGSGQVSPIIFGNGFRCIDTPLYRVKPLTTSNFVGDVIYNLDLNDLPAAGPIGPGETWNFMCWYRDPPAGGAQYNGSDALNTFWCP